MTFYYKTYSWGQGPSGVPEETRKLWEHIAEKKNWRIVQLPNGFYQAEYKDLDDQWVDVAIDKPRILNIVEVKENQ